MSTFKDGIRRYEIGESECQARLVCELHQKAVGRSFKSWLNTVLNTLGVEDYLESTTFGARTKSVMKDIYKAARNGIGEQDCAITYSKCPVSISVEPIRNSLLNKIVRGSSSGHTLSSQSKTAQVYGPSPSSSQQVNSQNSMHTPHSTKSPSSPPTQVPSINHQSSSLPSSVHSHLQAQSHVQSHHHPNSLPAAPSSLLKQPSLHKQYKSRWGKLKTHFINASISDMKVHFNGVTCKFINYLCWLSVNERVKEKIRRKNRLKESFPTPFYLDSLFAFVILTSSNMLEQETSVIDISLTSLSVSRLKGHQL